MMKLLNRRQAFAARAKDERGYTLLFVLALLVLALGIGAAVLTEALATNQITTHDQRMRRAQQAADAGIQAQLYQQAQNPATNAGGAYDLNGGLLNLSQFLDCVEPSINTNLQITGLLTASVTSGNCPGGGGGSGGSSLVGEPVGNHAFYKSEFFPQPKSVVGGDSLVELQPKIVALGYDDSNTSGTGNVYAREEAVLSPVEPLPVLGGNNNLAVSGVSISGGILSTLLGLLHLSSLATTVNGDIEASNNLTLPAIDASLNLTLTNGLLGVAEYGGSLSPAGGIRLAQIVNSAPPPEQPVTVSSSIPNCPNNTCTGSWTSYYNASTDSISVPSGSTMTLPGGEYVFCNFNAQGTVIASPSSTVPVQIFIDNPNSSRCTAGNGNPTLSTSNNSVTGHLEYNDGNFVAVNGVNNGVGNVTGTLGPSGLQIYDVGDQPQATNPDDGNTYVQIGNPSQTGTDGGLLSTNLATEAAVVYAPTSEVSMTTAQCANVVLATVCVPGTFTGNLIGNDVNATALTFTQDLNLGNYPLYAGINMYHVQQYVECAPVTSLTGNESTDTSGC
jgi:hypothetical protein